MRPVNLIFTCLLVFCAVGQDYNYDSNGDDWTFGDCAKNGTKQSPIELLEGSDVGVPNSYLIADFQQSQGTVFYFVDVNTTIYLLADSKFGSIYTQIINGDSVPFQATQIRLRVHAEHKVNGYYNDLELQIFHTELYSTTRNYRFAIALFFNVSTTADPFLQKLIDTEKQTNSTGIKNATISVDLSHLFSKNMIGNFWYYNGSPTIPICRNAQIHWAVYQNVFSMTQGQLDAITKILRGNRSQEEWKGNWRNIQPKNGNKVGYRQVKSGIQL